MYMGGSRVRAVADRFVRAGRSADTPAAVVVSGTLPDQRVVRGTLGDLADRVERAGELAGPALIVVGEVARLAEPLEWVRRGPLAGRTVLVARARSQRSRIGSALRELGATVVEFPTIRFRPGPDVTAVAPAVDALAAEPEGRRVLVFTGAAAVTRCLRALVRAGGDARSLAGLTLVAIGRGTIAELRGAGLRCDLALRSYLPIRVAAAIRRHAGPLEGLPVLLVRDGQEPSALGDGLMAAGARVTQLEIATRVVDGRGRQQLDRLIAHGRLDAVVLPSSSAAEALVTAGFTVPSSVEVIAIGPATAATAARRGLPRTRVPGGTGVDALTRELLAHLAEVGPAAPRRASASSGH